MLMRFYRTNSGQKISEIFPNLENLENTFNHFYSRGVRMMVELSFGVVDCGSSVSGVGCGVGVGRTPPITGTGGGFLVVDVDCVVGFLVGGAVVVVVVVVVVDVVVVI